MHSRPHRALTRRRTLEGLAAGAAALAMPRIARAATITWIGASATPPDDFISQALDLFGKRVEALSKGQIVLDNHHSGSLGGERENIEGLLQGAVHVASPGQGLLAGWYKPAEVWTYPYLFRDVPHKNKAWDVLRDDYIADIAKQARLRPVAAIPRMPRMLSCNKVVKVPDDMKGLKIRVPETTLWRRTFEMMGASPTPLPFPEVFQSLKSGIIDGQDNPLALTYNSGIYDVNTHCSLTEHMMQDNCLVIAEAEYRKLTPELRQAVDQAARDMEADMRPRVVADDARILELIKAKKVVISTVDKDAFRKAVAAIDTEFPAGQPWAKRIRAVA